MFIFYPLTSPFILGSCGRPFAFKTTKSIEHAHITGRSPLNPKNVQLKHVVTHLQTISPPLEVPEDLALRMALLVDVFFMHTFTSFFMNVLRDPLPISITTKNAPISPTDRLRTSTFPRKSSNVSPPSTQSYDNISDKLLNTYTLGELVGAAWELERIMCWTPTVAELERERHDTVLRSSGLYKVRGATVEGLVGRIFHQFGGAIAHRIFHTLILPHICHFGLPLSMHDSVRDACNRLGGQHDGLLTVEARQRQPVSSKTKSDTPSPTTEEDIDSKSSLPPKHESLPEADTVDFVKVGREGTRERRIRRLSVKG